MNLPASDNGNALILMYHRIAKVSTDPWSLSVDPQFFAEHLQVLRDCAYPVKLKDLIDLLGKGGDLRSESVAVTFDDGYSDNLYSAKPVLERYEIPATVFLATGYLGSNREFWWDELDRFLLQPGLLPATLQLTLGDTPTTWELGETAHYDDAAFQQHRTWKAEQEAPSSRQTLYRSLWGSMQRMPEAERQEALASVMAWAGALPESRPFFRPMTPQEVVTLADGGLIEVGAHTVTHPVLSSLPAIRQKEEIQRSKETVEDIVGYNISNFAYPYGDFNPESVAVLRECGFTSACSTAPSGVQKGNDLFQLPRIHVGNWSGEELAGRLSAWFAQ